MTSHVFRCHSRRGLSFSVILLQGEAELAYGDGSRMALKAGDYLLIKAHQKHRVEYTSSDPPCIWLAIHAKFQQQ